MKMIFCDTETMGTAENSIVLDLSLVAVDFNKRLDYTAEELIENGIKWKFDVQEQKTRSRIVAPETIEWWSQQSKEIRRRCVMPSDKDISIYSVLPLIHQWVDEQGFTNRAGKEHNFWLMTRGELEPKLFHRLYSDCGMIAQKDAFYDYNRWRDIRTALHFMIGAENGYIDIPITEHLKEQKHDSLIDCVIDTMMLQEALKQFV
jgi:hypothetical protein